MDETRTPMISRTMALSCSMTVTGQTGRLYVFEGIDGSGKSTVSKLFAERLARTGRAVEWTAEPTSGWIGQQVRRANKEAHSDFAETLLYIADRAEHSAQIRAWLEDGRDVVCDRYEGSTLAYQSVTLRPHLGPKALEWLRTVNAPFVLHPDATFLLRIDPESAMQRVSTRGETEKFEKIDFLRKVSSMYDRLAVEDLSYIIIDASKGLEEVVDTVWALQPR
ncbi:MAG: dTMP kinase [Methanomassiliicoccus sp.]|nr:dTMP kinase [Methanomassiliicoccus sp.]